MVGIIRDAVYGIGGVGGAKVFVAVVARNVGSTFKGKLGDHEDLLPF